MNQRIAFSAMAILLAAHVLSPTRSVEMAAIAGVYVSHGTNAAETYSLALSADASATLTIAGPSGVTIETGSWMLEGDAVQVAFMGAPGAGSATAATLEVRDGALVARPGVDETSRFAGLTFVKS
jgi:hypothetical protein